MAEKVNADNGTLIGKILLTGWNTANSTYSMAHFVDSAMKIAEKVVSNAPSSASRLITSKLVYTVADTILGPINDMITIFNAEKYISERVWEMQGKPSSSDLLASKKIKGGEFDHKASAATSFAQSGARATNGKTDEESVIEDIVKQISELDVADTITVTKCSIKDVATEVPGVTSSICRSLKRTQTLAGDILEPIDNIVAMVNTKSITAQRMWLSHGEPNCSYYSGNTKCKCAENGCNNNCAEYLKYEDKTKSITGKNQVLVGGGLKMMKFAGGGLVDRGELFIAREAGPELVGTIGNSSAVMNNDQIVAAVARGVASAIGSQRVNVNVDGKSLFDIIVNRNNAQVRQTGLSPLMG